MDGVYSKFDTVFLVLRKLHSLHLSGGSSYIDSDTFDVEVCYFGVNCQYFCTPLIISRIHWINSFAMVYSQLDDILCGILCSNARYYVMVPTFTHPFCRHNATHSLIHTCILSQFSCFSSKLDLSRTDITHLHPQALVNNTNLRTL